MSHTINLPFKYDYEVDKWLSLIHSNHAFWEKETLIVKSVILD